MKKIAIACLLMLQLFQGDLYAKTGEIQGPVPAPHQMKWHQAEMGVVFHYDLHVFDGEVYGQG